MWDWFVTNGILILICSAIGLLALLLIRRSVIAILENATPKKKHEKLERYINLAVGVIGGILLVIIATAVAAVIIYREGVAAIVTPDTTKAWFLEHGIYILIIIIVASAVYQLLKLVMPRIVERSVRVRGKGRRAREELTKRSQTLGGILTQIIGIIILITALLMALSEVGVNITPFLAGAGVAGIAIGFGAQSLVKDVLNGLFIIIEDQYRKGDVANISGIGGMVEDLTLRRTIIRDLEGIVHSIPNGEVKIASNYTKDWARIKLNIPVAYGENLDRVTEVINRVGSELAKDDYFGPKIITAPQVLWVDKLGDSGIEIRILGETKPLSQWEVKGELRKRVKKAFDEEGIEIPWPHLKLYLGQGKTNEHLICEACSHPNLHGSKFCANCGASLSSG
jgi:small-conductance mechanosensitive channel